MIERWSASYPMPRAVHCDHEIARILQNVGLRPDRSPAVEPYDAMYAWLNADRQDLMLVDWSGVGPTGWHTANFDGQGPPDAEQHLEDRDEPLLHQQVERGAHGRVGRSASAGVDLEEVRGVDKREPRR